MYCWTELTFGLLLLALTLVEYPSVFPSFPWQAAVVIDALCIAFFTANLYYRGLGLGAKISVRTHPTFCLRLVVLLLLIVNLGLTIAYPTSARFVRVVRVVLILDPEYAEGVRRVCRQTMITTYEIFDMLVLLVLYILLFSVLAFYFFSDNQNDPYFATLGTSYVSLFILMTTANYPDVMMPSYYKNEFACLFFIFYMMFGFYLLTNIVLSMVYESFTDTEQRKFKRMWKHKRRGVRLAWERTMSVDDEGMPFQRFYMIAKAYKDSLSDKHIYLAYRSLDTDFNGQISFKEFQNIFEVLDVSYVLVYQEEGDPNDLFWWAHLSGGIRDFMRKLKDVVEHKYFEYAIDIVILINTLYVVVQAAQEHPQSSGSGDANTDRTGNMEWVFFSIYLCELLAKIIALGYKEYFSRSWYRFDFFVVTASAIGIIVQETSSTEKSAQMTVFIRSLRLLRLIKVRESFRDVVTGMAYLVPKTGRFVCALLTFYYVFAIVGMGLFNDTVSRCSPFSGIACDSSPRACGNDTAIFLCASDAEAICSADPYGGLCVSDNRYQCAPKGLNCGSEYAVLPPAYAITGRPHSNVAGLYQINNFNNVLRAYVLLFEQMIVNNWFVAMNGHVYMTSEWARVYFMVFFLFAVQVVTNIIIAFIIDTFMTVFPLLKIKGKDGSKGWNRAYCEQVEIRIQEAQAIFPASDLEVLLPVQMLKYKASTELRSADIDRILFGDDIEDWLKEEHTASAGVWEDDLAPKTLEEDEEVIVDTQVRSRTRREISTTADQRIQKSRSTLYDYEK